VSPTFSDGLLIWIVALFVGRDEPTLNVDRYAIDAACCTGVIVPATIWSSRCPVSLYGTYALNAPPGRAGRRRREALRRERDPRLQADRVDVVLVERERLRLVLEELVDRRRRCPTSSPS
jgi:hypothetical protein